MFGRAHSVLHGRGEREKWVRLATVGRRASVVGAYVGWLLTVLASSIHTQHQMRITLRAPIAGEETELLFLGSIALSIVGCAHGPCCKIHRVKATWRVASRILPTRKDRPCRSDPRSLSRLAVSCWTLSLEDPEDMLRRSPPEGKA